MAVFTRLLRASFRHRWCSWVLLCVLIALVSGLVGVLSVTTVAAWVIAAVAAATIVVANALAIGPALAAPGSHPASLLRSGVISCRDGLE